MSKLKKIAIFEGRKIRRHWDDKKEKWYFSVVDIVAVLSGSVDARKYWNKLAQRLREEGSEVVTKCRRLKMQASDGKYYLTDVADTETMLRIIQSVPSPNAEPFKLWLSRGGYERVEEAEDPEFNVPVLGKPQSGNLAPDMRFQNFKVVQISEHRSLDFLAHSKW